MPTTHSPSCMLTSVLRSSLTAVEALTGNLMKLHRMEPTHMRMNAVIAKMDVTPA